ncbi:hypothetical protein GMRT_14550 [Giardia muris]|uniref:Uncharacterized protein n=1 Tax=Giardia muris TaxID=5742 RepID=A0A4Z1SVX3_GIAMU|nr:hypothetical protein GMRT_14550 [Giardia muris]|eukprot:TNJ29055.1 hypothetical protein GMRT_14550 [Giardia muris]
MLNQGGIAQGLYWSMYDQNEQDTSLDQLIASDNLEKLLEVKVLAFELRGQSEPLIEYLSRPATLKRLLRIVFNVKQTNELTERAIEVLQCSENLKSILPNLVSDPELLQLPFEALARNVRGLTGGPTDALPPGALCEPFIYLGFNKLISSIFAVPDRIKPVVDFLRANLKYMRAWAAHTVNSLAADSLRLLLVEYTGRSEELTKDIADLTIASGIIFALVDFVTPANPTAVPFECSSSSAALLSQIIYKEVPHLYKVVIDRIPLLAEFTFGAQVHGPSIMRLPLAADVLVCGLSSMITKTTLCYHANKDAIGAAGITQAVLDRRAEEMTKFVDEKKAPQQAHLAKLRAESGNGALPQFRLTPLGVKEIDTLETQYLRTYALVLQLLNMLPSRFQYMASLAHPGTLGVGYFVMLVVVGRILSITADVRNQLYFVRTGVNPLHEWIAGNSGGVAVSNTFDYSVYASLSNFANAGAGGSSQTPFTDSLYVESNGIRVPFQLTVANLALKLLQLKILSHVVTLFKKFPEHSNLHFVISRILLPLFEFGGYIPSIPMSILSETSFLKDMRGISDEYTAFKARDSRLSYYVTFARAMLRMSVRLSDESALEEKRRFVSANQSRNVLTTMSCPQTVPALVALMKEGHSGIFKNICEFLVENEDFKHFSRVHLEPEDDIPKTFGDARLSSDYAEAKKHLSSNKQQTVASEFTWTVMPEENGDSVFGNFGDFTGIAGDHQDGSTFGVGDLSSATSVEDADLYSQFANMW